MTCCACARECAHPAEYRHIVCLTHAALRWKPIAVALLLTFSTGCAHTVNSAPLVMAATQPASEPASQPGDETVCFPRSRLNALANKVLQHGRDQSLALVDCQKNFRVMTDDDKATHALLDDANTKLKIVAIAGPVATVVAAVVAAIAAHYAR